MSMYISFISFFFFIFAFTFPSYQSNLHWPNQWFTRIKLVHNPPPPSKLSVHKYRLVNSPLCARTQPHTHTHDYYAFEFTCPFPLRSRRILYYSTEEGKKMRLEWIWVIIESNTWDILGWCTAWPFLVFSPNTLSFHTPPHPCLWRCLGTWWYHG